MKIGIMTFCTTQEHNYGQILQCFALQRYLRNLGHDAYVINYEHIRKQKKKSVWRRELYALKLFPVLFPQKQEKHLKAVLEKKNAIGLYRFGEFLNRYMAFSSEQYMKPAELQKNPPEADVYIVGSDQVWNAELLGYDSQKIHIFFLDFGSSDTPRISYAASWGQSIISEDYAKIITPLLQRFCSISVREKSGLDICRKIGIDDAKWVCDPTLLLSAEEYRKIYNENPICRRDKKYILIYMLDDRDIDFLAVSEFAEKKGLEILNIADSSSHLKNAITVYPTIPEWLYLIDNAEYVLTKSFHCAIFSTIFGKQYGSVARVKNSTGKNTRLDSLFEMCNIAPRWLNEDEGFSILDKKYTADFSAFRQDSMRFLDDALKNIYEEKNSRCR